MLTANQVRQKYFEFFQKQQHALIPSASLVPENDPTTLFTGSGMQPLLPNFLGQPHPQGKRLVDSQKCFRSQDIEEVGDNRHITFFEMLGNWSLGDYFKKEQISWVFEFLTKEVGLDPHNLYVTVYAGNSDLGILRDEEAVEFWQKEFAKFGIEAKPVDQAQEKGLQGGRIFFYGDAKNWWSRSGEPKKMPAGEPGGPDSEMFYDFGAELKLHENSPFKNEPCHVNCDCGRFLEIGNSVFMQYQKQDDGSFKELPQKNVDFGGGLERILAAANHDRDVFKTDLFMPIITKLEEISGHKYEETAAYTQSFRVIADHLRGAAFLTADGVFPSNKAQGYYLRRLVRRAVRFGKMIGISGEFFADLLPVVTEIYTQHFSYLSDKQSQIIEVLRAEEVKFLRTLEKGLREFEKTFSSSVATDEANTAQNKTLTAALAFKMFETYGFPLEMSVEEAGRKNCSIETDIENKFNSFKGQHANQSRTASVGQFKGGLEDHSDLAVKFHTATHLLHAALRQVLGKHVAQKGSNINPERLRFDFSHPEAVTPEQMKQVEAQINDWIKADLPVHKQVMAKTEALAAGALAFFVEKYPDTVNVYTVGQDPDKGWVSKELCGGPHVARTGEIGQIELFKEKAVAAGTRRIYGRIAQTNS
ncbi:MAG: alanine--tRNA ligase [Patescibacteria group bacterium]